MKRVLTVVGLCALLLHTGCHSEKEAHHEKEAKLPVTHPVKMDTAITQEYVCQIHSIQHIELRAQERGYLQKIYVDEGQFVKKGQLLFQIMPALYEAELQKAQAEVNFANIEYKNTKRLADSNVVAPNELAMAEAKLDKANAELALARVHLQLTQIKAPFDGIIDRFQVRQGSLVDEGDLLTNLSDNSHMWVYFNVPEAEYLDYMTRTTKDSTTKVNLLMANNRLFDQTGTIETIEADFNNETGNIPFRATFPNPKGLLRHGETGNIVMNIALKDALIIPQKVTFEVLDKKYVYVVDEDHRLKSREITIAAEMPHIYVVQDGLTENDKILLDGLRLVRENDEIDSELVEGRIALSQLDLYAE
ncbi:efflux RND transporter periplasmic adaptor subunit [Fulvivirga ulvae]|uniref:efflux RND transporter periplasmic adaptor subunit n=1 Tax=Fulvivirga ulvae TaxID=2904245 RepID=UPI001F2549EB|nr:efflux RND transporter periplasmic adaptor subunit [Fulvivirga ulvae]UII35071.1 efflux RND transporter periplasmic adaptor subunit [Fulvivirga ulvae]